MKMVDDRRALIKTLQKNILQWEGYKPAPENKQDLLGLGPVEAAFPNGVFPLGTVHELVCENMEQATASSGLISALLSVLMRKGGACLWISLTGTVFPAAMKGFGLEADRMIFINVAKDKDALWVTEEALKCAGLAAVVAEVAELDFKQSRRLQLAVEQSRVTGFILRNAGKKVGATACAARWQVKPLPSMTPDGLPGLGFSRWRVDLLRVRNGHPGSWITEWAEGRFRVIRQREGLDEQNQKAS